MKSSQFYNKKENNVANTTHTIGEVEFVRRQLIVEKTVKSPFFNLQIFTDGQSLYQDRIEADRLQGPKP